jgi:hypothetical protein
MLSQSFFDFSTIMSLGILGNTILGVRNLGILISNSSPYFYFIVYPGLTTPGVPAFGSVCVFRRYPPGCLLAHIYESCVEGFLGYLLSAINW